MEIIFDKAAGLALGCLHSPLSFHCYLITNNSEIKYSIYIERMFSNNLSAKADNNIFDLFCWFPLLNLWLISDDIRSVSLQWYTLQTTVMRRVPLSMEDYSCPFEYSI